MIHVVPKLESAHTMDEAFLPRGMFGRSSAFVAAHNFFIEAGLHGLCYHVTE